MTEILVFGEYEVAVEMEIGKINHFCSGVYCYDLSWHIYHNGEVKASIYTDSVLTPERLKHILATGIARLLDKWMKEEFSDTNVRCAFYIANRPLEENAEYGMYKCRYGVSQYDVWDALPTQKHLMHSQSYDEGSEVWCFSLEFETYYEENGVQRFFIPHDEYKYEEVRKEVFEELEARKTEEEPEEMDSLIDNILNEVGL